MTETEDGYPRRKTKSKQGKEKKMEGNPRQRMKKSIIGMDIGMPL